MWIYYNPNPVRDSPVGDCSVRAIAKALNISWDEAHDLLSHNAKLMGDIQNANAVWGSVLRQHGFKRAAIPNYCPDCYTAEDFCKDHPYGIYVLSFGNHVATVVDGAVFDSWNSLHETPQYYWYLEE